MGRRRLARAKPVKRVLLLPAPFAFTTLATLATFFHEQDGLVRCRAIHGATAT